MSKSAFFCPTLFPEEYYCPACAINRGFGGSMHIVRFGLKHKHICINCKNDYYEEKISGTNDVFTFKFIIYNSEL